MRGAALAALLLALALPAAAEPAADPAGYVAARQGADGGFAEPGRSSDPSLTAWSVLGLRAAGRSPADPGAAVAYLSSQPYPTANELALRVLALAALGEDTRALADRLASLRRRDGRIGPLVNSTAWGALALRAAGRPVGASTVRYLLRRQHASGGWPWAPGGAPDSNDTAAVLQALRAAGVRGQPIMRGLAYLRRLHAPRGGFRLTPGREPDAQSTAWALQAFAAAHARPPAKARAFLRSLRRADGSFRYSRRYVTTPALVTAQALPALAGTPFPLRAP